MAKPFVNEPAVGTSEGVATTDLNFMLCVEILVQMIKHSIVVYPADDQVCQNLANASKEHGRCSTQTGRGVYRLR